MDPLTHTFLGAVLADTGLKRRTPLAMATLVIGSNLPDVDVFAYAGGSDNALFVRRGWTHGVLAVVVLPFVLTLLMLAFDRLRRRWGHDGPPVRPGRILALAALAIVSHPLLDWLNTYGVRFLMPFEGRWFYGDALFIIDPWVWLVFGGALFAVHSRTLRGRINWTIVGAMTTAAVMSGGGWARWLWILGVALWIVLRWRFHDALVADEGRRLARGALAFGVLYVAFMAGTTAIARHDIAGELEAADLDVERFMVGPVVFDPLTRMAVVETSTTIRFGVYHPLSDPRFRLEERVILRRRTAAVEAALGASCARGMAGWMRYPFFEVDETDEGSVVYILDARYVRGRARGFGATAVVLDTDGRPVGCEPPPI